MEIKQKASLFAAGTALALASSKFAIGLGSGSMAVVSSALNYPKVGYHELRTRRSGSKKYIDFHLLLCRKLHIDEAHELSDIVENDIAGKIMLVDVVVHIEPCERECDLTEKTCLILKSLSSKEQTSEVVAVA